MKRFLVFLLAAALLMMGAAAETDVLETRYEQAWDCAMSGNYSMACSIYRELGDYRDSEQLAYLLGVYNYAENIRKISVAVLAYEFHDQWGLINLQDFSLTAPTWDSIGNVDLGGLARVELNGLYGYVNTMGETVIACEWDDVSDFSMDGLCTVEKDGLYGMMNLEGALLTPAQWRKLSLSEDRLYSPCFFDNGLMVVQGQNWKYGLMNALGELIGEVCWDDAPDLSQDMPLVRRNYLYGFLDGQGNVLIEPQYRGALPFSEGLAAVSADGRRVQYIDAENRVIIPPVYEDVQSFVGGVAHVKLPGMSWQIIDRTGQLVYFVTDQIRADYDAAVSMKAAEDYAGAEALFAKTIGYRDSYAQMKDAQYLASLKAAYDEGLASMAGERYAEAIKAFDAASGYRDADEQAINARETVYLKASGLFDEGKYWEAIPLFGIIADYKDSQRQLQYAESQIKSNLAFEVVNNGKYGFALNDKGYYESRNKKIANSYAMCEVRFRAPSGVIYLDCINYADQMRDFALISVLDKPLSKVNSVDMTNVHTSFKYKNSPAVQTIEIPVPDKGIHTICIKYRKDGSGNAGNDTFQFRIRFE